MYSFDSFILGHDFENYHSFAKDRNDAQFYMLFFCFISDIFFWKSNEDVLSTLSLILRNHPCLQREWRKLLFTTYYIWVTVRSFWVDFSAAESLKSDIFDFSPCILEKDHCLCGVKGKILYWITYCILVDVRKFFRCSLQRSWKLSCFEAIVSNFTPISWRISLEKTHSVYCDYRETLIPYQLLFGCGESFFQ